MAKDWQKNRQESGRDFEEANATRDLIEHATLLIWTRRLLQQEQERPIRATASACAELQVVWKSKGLMGDLRRVESSEQIAIVCIHYRERRKAEVLFVVLGLSRSISGAAILSYVDSQSISVVSSDQGKATRNRRIDNAVSHLSHELAAFQSHRRLEERKKDAGKSMTKTSYVSELSRLSTPQRHFNNLLLCQLYQCGCQNNNSQFRARVIVWHPKKGKFRSEQVPLRSVRESERWVEAPKSRMICRHGRRFCTMPYASDN